MKKGQGLSLNMIVIAAIALIVLIVVIWIFYGGSVSFVKGSTCSARGGVCMSDNLGKGCPDGKQITVIAYPCKEVVKEGEGYLIKKEDGKEVSPGQCCVSLG